MKILWLTSWYPSRVNFLSGDFIERHAKNAALFNDTFVIHVVKDPKLKGIKSVLEEIKYSDRLSALIIYYPAFKKLGKWFEVLLSNVYFITLHWKGFSIYRKRFGKPNGVLAFVALKAGIIALMWKIVFGIPYILFERWTGLLKEAKPNIREKPFSERLIWKYAAKNSEMLAVVSDYFGKSICEFILNKQYIVIPNSVDDNLFFPIKKNLPETLKFIHVSTLEYQKNFEDIAKAIQIVILNGFELEFKVYGPVSKNHIDLIEKLNLTNVITFHGEVTHNKIAEAMQNSDALILYSRFETFGNVIVEANACGIPVIVSDFPVFKEIVIDRITGIFARGQDANDLAKKIIWLIENYKNFDQYIISESVQKRYNPNKIGSLFNDLYKNNF